MEDIDWTTITQAQAKRRLGAAMRASNAADRRARDADTEEACQEALRVYTVWEDLRVFVLCGERPS